MYKFSNGIVVFDEKTKDEYIKSGMKLVEEQITVEKVIEKVEDDGKKHNDDSVIERKPNQRYKISR